MLYSFKRGEHMSELGQFLKEKRESSGLSLKKLSSATGISDSELLKIENGTRKKPGWEHLCKIAKALKFHPFEVLLNAGYISESDIHPPLLINGLEDLNEQQLNTVQLFVDFIKTQERTCLND